MFNGLEMDMANLSRLSNAKSRSISAENFTGEPGKGGMATEGGGKPFTQDLGPGWKVSPFVVVEKRSTFTLADVKGMGAIQSMWMTGNVTNDSILRIYWDGQEKPSVEVPIPAFFALFTNTNTNNNGKFPFLNSAAVMIAPNRGFNCFWQMPFRTSFRMTVENRSDADITIFYQINYTLTDIPDDCAYFHAQYRQSCPVKYKEVHTILDGVKGKGQFVGCALYAGLNRAGGWWGEGEVKFYIDDDTDYPTICGTGTEDYFLGAYDWDVNKQYQTYSGLYAGMFQMLPPDALYSSQTRFCMYRWHIPDPVRFEKGIKVTIQDLGWRVNSSGRRFLAREDDIKTVAFWYQTLPAADFPELPTPDEIQII